jgi:hypothetical protein
MSVSRLERFFSGVARQWRFGKRWLGSGRKGWLWSGMGRLLIICLVLMGLPLSGSAQDMARLAGEWGTEAQCAGALILPGGTRRAASVRISAGWLQQGETWCALNWYRPQAQQHGFYVAAEAVCGEDSQRAWHLGFAYREGNAEHLMLFWDEDLVNGPLNRCSPID